MVLGLLRLGVLPLGLSSVLLGELSMTLGAMVHLVLLAELVEALVATGAASVVSSLHLVKMSLLVVLHELLGMLLGVLSVLGSLLVVLLLGVSLLHHATEVDGGWGREVVGRVGATCQEDGRWELLDSSLGPLLGGLLDELLLV